VQASIDALRRDMAKRAAVDAGAVVDLPNPLMRHARA
jgi:hypothetical protein